MRLRFGLLDPRLVTGIDPYRMSDPQIGRLRALPFAVLKTEDGVVLKRGATEVSFLGEGAAEFVEVVRKATGDGASRDEIRHLFPESEGPVVDLLLDQLVARRLLVQASERPEGGSPEGAIDIFYWQYGDSSRQVAERLTRANIVLVGINSISRRIAHSLVVSGVTAFAIVDDPRLRNERISEPDEARGSSWPDRIAEPLRRDEWRSTVAKARQCIVATSDLGNQETLREYNAFSVERGHHFLPVFLQNFVGYIGPLVVPGETACFDCLETRWNAQLDPDGTAMAKSEPGDGPSVVGFHPVMASALGDVAAFELVKHYGRALPVPRIGSQIELNLLTPRMTTRRILKVPRCRTCSPLRSRAPISAKK
jgi:thiazole/oxazole-forming peptide maturase SagC family component